MSREVSQVIGSAKQKQLLKWKTLFEPYGLDDFDREGGCADINPLSNQGTLLIGLLPDEQRYFRYHHAEDDVFEAVNRRELELSAASMANLVYLSDQYGIANK